MCWPLEGQVPQPWMQVLVGAVGNPRAECFSVSTEVWWWVKCLLLAASASTFAGSFLWWFPRDTARHPSIRGLASELRVHSISAQFEVIRHRAK